MSRHHPLLGAFDRFCCLTLPIPSNLEISVEHPLVFAVSGNKTNPLYTQNFGRWVRLVQQQGQPCGVSILALDQQDRPLIRVYEHDGVMGAQNFLKNPQEPFWSAQVDPAAWVEAVIRDAAPYLAETQTWHTTFEEELHGNLSEWLNDNKSVIMANPQILGMKYKGRTSVTEEDFPQFIKTHLDAFFASIFASFSEKYEESDLLKTQLISTAKQLANPGNKVTQAIVVTAKDYAKIPQDSQAVTPAQAQAYETALRYLACETLAIEQIINDLIGTTPYQGAYCYLGSRSPMVAETLTAQGRAPENSWMGPHIQFQNAENFMQEMQAMLYETAACTAVIEEAKSALSVDQVTALADAKKALELKQKDFTKKCGVLVEIAGCYDASKAPIEQLPLTVDRKVFPKLHSLTGVVDASRKLLQECLEISAGIKKSCQDALVQAAKKQQATARCALWQPPTQSTERNGTSLRRSKPRFLLRVVTEEQVEPEQRDRKAASLTLEELHRRTVEIVALGELIGNLRDPAEREHYSGLLLKELLTTRDQPADLPLASTSAAASLVGPGVFQKPPKRDRCPSAPTVIGERARSHSSPPVVEGNLYPTEQPTTLSPVIKVGGGSHFKF